MEKIMKDRIISSTGSPNGSNIDQELAVDEERKQLEGTLLLKRNSSKNLEESRNDLELLAVESSQASMESSSIHSFHFEGNHRDVIQEALDKASSSVIQSAAKALALGEGGVSQSPPTHDELKLGSTTKEVLASANYLLQETKMEREKRVKVNLPTDVTSLDRSTNSISSKNGPTHDDDVDDDDNNNNAESTLEPIGDDKNANDPLTSRINQQPESLPRNTLLRKIDGAIPTQDSILDKEEKSNNDSDCDDDSDDGDDDGGNCATTPTSDVKVKPIHIESSVAVKPSPLIEQQDKYSPSTWFKSFIGCDTEDQSRKYEYGGQVAMTSSLVKVALESVSKSYNLLAVGSALLDPRMPEWIKAQYMTKRDEPPKDGQYEMGKSRTIIVHEIIRESWTWATAWSPEGDLLAVATENHNLAIIDTTSSSVWRITHDKRSINTKTQGSQSIRSIAWGSQFIATGGVGNAVSIHAPTEPYPVLHTISHVDFVGSLDWKMDSNILLIGSRNGTATIVKVEAQDGQANDSVSANRIVQSTIIHTIKRDAAAWVNAVQFSPSGSAFALGDSDGIVSVYDYKECPGELAISNIANFKMEDSILSVEWSPDGKWLYAGGEDFAVTIIDTKEWEAIRRIRREKWVQFISSSHGGSHIAIGGVSNEVSILDVEEQWDSGMNVAMKGMNPLSAKWHPKDQYLVLTGQNNSILAVETTSARYVSGHFLRSSSPILAIEFSPDGSMVAIGNMAGILSIFKLTDTSFTTTYEMVLDCYESLSIEWSSNGAFLAIATRNKVVIISRLNTKNQSTSPPNASGFSVAKVIRDSGIITDVAIDPRNCFLAVCGSKTSIFDARSNFDMVLEMSNASHRALSLANAWSSDGKWFAMIGREQNLVFYDTTSQIPYEWRSIFEVQITEAGLALAWGPPSKRGLRYCAFGGEDKTIHILELRDKEKSWEKVLEVPRDGFVNDLDWNKDGLLAAAISDGTVTVMDLSYLRSGWAVNEMDYNWQRQALTCFTEIRRNRGKNCMQTARWIPSANGSDSLLAVGGTDGEVEIIDLTARNRCTGFSIVDSPVKHK